MGHKAWSQHGNGKIFVPLSQECRLGISVGWSECITGNFRWDEVSASPNTLLPLQSVGETESVPRAWHPCLGWVCLPHGTPFAIACAFSQAAVHSVAHSWRRRGINLLGQSLLVVSVPLSSLGWHLFPCGTASDVGLDLTVHWYCHILFCNRKMTEKLGIWSCKNLSHCHVEKSSLLPCGETLCLCQSGLKPQSSQKAAMLAFTLRK